MWTILAALRRRCFGAAGLFQVPGMQHTDYLPAAVKKSGLELAVSLPKSGAGPVPVADTVAVAAGADQGVLLVVEPLLRPCKTEHYLDLVSEDLGMATKLDIEVVLFTSASQAHLSPKASLIAYLEEQAYRSAEGLAAEALAADNSARRLDSLVELAASLHIDGSWDQVDVTWRTLIEPHSLVSP